MSETPEYELEQLFQVWNNQTGERIDIGPDRDGLGLTEIRTYTDDQKPAATITLTPEQLPLVIEALQRLHNADTGS
jgi:hypothetical protein